MTVRQPDFENNLLRVLRGQCPERPTLFEMIIAPEYFSLMAKAPQPDIVRLQIDAMITGGYDYLMTYAAGFLFRENFRVS